MTRSSLGSLCYQIPTLDDIITAHSAFFLDIMNKIIVGMDSSHRLDILLSLPGMETNRITKVLNQY
jgi:hypothetical protein